MTLKQQYKKERKRVLNMFNRYKKSGLDISIEVPKIPKRITQGSINRLKKLTPKYVQSKSFAPDLQTGEQITFSQFKKQYGGIKLLKTSYDIVFSPVPVTFPEDLVPKAEKRATEVLEDLPNFADIVIGQYMEMANRYPDNTRDIMLNWLRQCVNEYGAEATAEMLEAANNDGAILTPEEAYKDSQVYESIAKAMTFLDVSAAEKNVILNDLFEEAGFSEEFF